MSKDHLKRERIHLRNKHDLRRHHPDMWFREEPKGIFVAAHNPPLGILFGVITPQMCRDYLKRLEKIDV